MKYLQIGGAPGSVVVVGFFVYRWLNLRLTAIDTVLKELKNGKRWTETCDEKHIEVERRLGRIETVLNGRLKA